MTVSSILAEKGKRVFTVTPNVTLEQAVKILAENRIGVVVVVESGDEVCGILSERDVVRELSKAGASETILGRSVESCMTSKVISCSEDDTIERVMEVMTRHRFRHMPVVSDGKLTGLISISDVVKRKIQQTEKDAEEMRNYIASS